MREEKRGGGLGNRESGPSWQQQSRCKAKKRWPRPFYQGEMPASQWSAQTRLYDLNLRAAKLKRWQSFLINILCFSYFTCLRFTFSCGVSTCNWKCPKTRLRHCWWFWAATYGISTRFDEVERIFRHMAGSKGSISLQQYLRVLSQEYHSVRTGFDKKSWRLPLLHLFPGPGIAYSEFAMYWQSMVQAPKDLGSVFDSLWYHRVRVHH